MEENSMGDSRHPRVILKNFVSVEECKELEFIHKSCCTVGYRPNVFSTTLSHLIATRSPHLILPFVPIRERLKEKLEECFGCEYELFIEFTGLISWTRGASIGWHSDDNRPYLKQRDFAAVCYLNSYGNDFKGGLFHFQDGDPTTIEPLAGDVVMYTADCRNIHSVDEITDGERLTLTLWFSRDCSHDEDAKLVCLLSQSQLHSSNNEPDPYLPLPASSSMYWFSPDHISQHQSGFDICWARMHILGYDLFSPQDKSCFSALDSSCDFSERLMEQLQLARGDELFDLEFVNILHVLQVVQFYSWKASKLQTSKVERETENLVVKLSESQREKINNLRTTFLNDQQLAETVLGTSCGESRQHSFQWVSFSAAVGAWEDYTRELRKELVLSLPYWRTHQAIFSVPFDGS
ncbi:hypothetical protein VitviT2T_000523 [Vitis vinifera]|uniref:procollagen-proline 3-dioxygenase n=2 Tax=Vitis vinifera TaxID=29760 RepID=A0ABY9BDF6_VITVI|nr:uncharacterized protein LOC100256078 isoform X1 [Vitis vinifera]WJZ80617.1 hypothetical protein VitviT2T_000523 [Vitis vinifera]|eukprot:XP_002285151.2 PREDICTED: uncharacterized protein LOC100256078 isoform X2 [Vitis vinifera]